ncbi:tetratricopeptide repeat protein [Mucilaginibacter sp. AW1-3]
MFRKLFLVFTLVCLAKVNAFANFDFNSNCALAYKTLMSLRLNEARVLINREKAVHPQNSVTILLDNYYDFFTILTTENRAQFEKLQANKSLRINKLEDEDQNSPYYNYSIAQVNLQWALLHSRFAEYTTAGFEINKAYKLLQANNKKFPNFLPTNIPLGVVNVLLGSLPGSPLKSILAFFGIKGDTQTGIKMLEKLSETLKTSGYAFSYEELVFYLTYIQTDVVNDPFAYNKMLHLVNSIDSASLLKSYIAGYVALRTGHSNEAIGLLQNRAQGPEYQPYAYMDYLLAIAKMNRGDDDANNYFNKFLKTYTGVNFIKDAYLHLGWMCLLEGDTKRYYAFVDLVKTKGSLYNDKDKQALDEANDNAPDVNLLRARLLCDGGFYTKAIAALSNKTTADFTLPRDKIEYYYRLGRIYDAMDKDDEAIKYYNNAIAIGRTSTYHYAASSAIRIGIIYEERKDFARARSAYNMVFDFKNTQFKNSLQQKAKDGLKRSGAK